MTTTLLPSICFFNEDFLVLKSNVDVVGVQFQPRAPRNNFEDGGKLFPYWSHTLLGFMKDQY